MRHDIISFLSTVVTIFAVTLTFVVRCWRSLRGLETMVREWNGADGEVPMRKRIKTIETDIIILKEKING